MRLQILGKDKDTSSARMRTLWRISVLGFKPCSAAAGAPTQAPRACTGRAGPAPAPRSSPALPAPPKPAQLSARPSRAVPFLWLQHQGKAPLASRPCVDLCYVLTRFLPVVKSSPIHRLQRCLEIQTFKEAILPAHPLQKQQQSILSCAHTQTLAVKYLRTWGEGSKYSDR